MLIFDNGLPDLTFTSDGATQLCHPTHSIMGGIWKQQMSDQNDPRVLFAAERTLLAWNRTSLTLMAFGFVIERFGLFVHMLLPHTAEPLQRNASFWIGFAFIVLGATAATAAVAQYRAVLRMLKPDEIPKGYRVNLGVFANLAVAALGVVLIAYLFIHGPGF